MNIRKLSLKEILVSNIQLTEVIKFSIGYPTPDKILKALDLYKNLDCKLIGAFLDDELIGVLGIKYTINKIIISHVSIKPYFRKQGIGKKLIEFIEKSYPAYKIIAETDDEAIGFYLKLGFSCSLLMSKYKILHYKCQLI